MSIPSMTTKTILVAALTLVTAAMAQQPHKKHWALTEAETLWFGRYSNCQYGYYVVLHSGIVAHAEHPPAPHHGFVVSLPDASSRREANVYNSERYVWLNGEYNVTEESSISGISNYEIDLTSRGKKSFRLVERNAVSVRSIPATRFKAEYESSTGQVIEEVVVVLRSGIAYQFGFRTSPEHYGDDRATFERVIAGVRFTRMPNGQCWNE